MSSEDQDSTGKNNTDDEEEDEDDTVYGDDDDDDDDDRTEDGGDDDYYNADGDDSLPQKSKKKKKGVGKKASRQSGDCSRVSVLNKEQVVSDTEQTAHQHCACEDGDKEKELFTNTFVESGPHALGLMDALQLSVVLEELSDQLDVIGISIDSPQVDLRSKASMEYDQAVHRPVFSIPATVDPYSTNIFKEKYILRQHYESMASRRINQMCTSKLTPGSRFRKRLTMVLRDHGVNKFQEKGKVMAERTQINIILDNAATELIQDMTFNSLLWAVDKEKEKYEGMKEKVEKSIEQEQRITDTKATLKRMRIEKKNAKKDMQALLWDFEDHRQELSRRKELEFLYIEHHGKMTTHRMKKMCAKSDKNDKEAMEDMNKTIKTYTDVHYSMLDMIYKKYKETQRKLEYWMEKYEFDKENLQADLDEMKANRARDLERIEWLKMYIKDYDQIVQDERRIQRIASQRKELEATKLKKSICIQAWWRGTMVRNHIGPYDPKKQAKKGKKGKKGKGKGKGKKK